MYLKLILSTAVIGTLLVFGLYADKLLMVRHYLAWPNPHLHQFSEADLITDLAMQQKSPYWHDVLKTELGAAN